MEKVNLMATGHTLTIESKGKFIKTFKVTDQVQTDINLYLKENGMVVSEESLANFPWIEQKKKMPNKKNCRELCAMATGQDYQSMEKYHGTKTVIPVYDLGECGYVACGTDQELKDVNEYLECKMTFPDVKWMEKFLNGKRICIYISE